ncbi:hypothetical protein FA10DRAFT_263677 [Acaromyces ingoldii]|uniref:Uncharacterized protein n=1 Tax=Acaromyces ingoldii TaxID=215250 RepID=A0A316YUK3_9BASI|nr:hypothetical protein FA10DRAFT_263677 [Acaromyces ingoldii]PWN92949.1 hypothetical protein FA10DRAFT_263677 [Acaromyces ingoldii]
MERLEEARVQEGFHALLQSALLHAKTEGLLSDADLQRADADFQITAPSLTLFFAALQARGDPPSIQAPSGAFELTRDNAPESFASFFALWQSCVPKIKSLNSEARHDLALLLCDREAASSPLRGDVARLAADIKTVAIDIVQRRTFQMRFQADLDEALGHRASTEYTPPPGYETGASEQKSSQTGRRPPPLPPKNGALPPQTSGALPPDEDTLSLIRETLFAALGDSIATNPSLRDVMRRGPTWASRAYYASLCLAILDVALTRVATHAAEVEVRTVQLNDHAVEPIRRSSCPANLVSLLVQLGHVAERCQSLREADDERAIKDAERGQETPEGARLVDELTQRLLGDVGERRRSEDIERREADLQRQVGETAIMINRLAMAMFEIPSFRERQADAFRVLGAITAL